MMTGRRSLLSLGEQALRALGLAFTPHAYDYRKKGAEAAAEALGLAPVDHDQDPVGRAQH